MAAQDKTERKDGRKEGRIGGSIEEGQRGRGGERREKKEENIHTHTHIYIYIYIYRKPAEGKRPVVGTAVVQDRPLRPRTPVQRGTSLPPPRLRIYKESKEAGKSKGKSKERTAREAKKKSQKAKKRQT